MDRHDWLADRFEANRAHLRSVAYRMLGSRSEADDAVQEAWLRLARADAAGGAAGGAAAVENLGGWLTTVVARVCLDMLRARASRREEPLDAAPGAAHPVTAHATTVDPEADAVVADSVGAALLVVLDTLAPAERLAFVLHDLFGVPFEEIGPIVGRTPVAARQLASRARRRVRGGAARPATPADVDRRRRVVEAFLAASRGGDLDALLALLDPDAVVRADAAAAAMGAPAELRGARAVAGMFAGRAQVARPALLGGDAGAVWMAGGRVRVAFAFTIVDGRVAAIDLLADPERIARLDPVPLDG